MIHTEKGRLIELIAFMAKDREFVAEVLGVGPSGIKSADKSLINSPARLKKFQDRFDAQTEIIEALRALL